MIKKITFLFFCFCLSPGFSQILEIRFPEAAMKDAFTGKVLVYLSKDNKTPKNNMPGFEPLACFSVDVSNVPPGKFITVNDKALSYPVALSELERGEYYIQAVWDRNLGGRAIGESPGNIYNDAFKIELTKNRKKKYQVTCDKIIPQPGFKETRFAKKLHVPSALLEKFYQRPVAVEAAVHLPKSYYENPDRKYPLLFLISGFGGNHHKLSGDSMPSRDMDSIQVIRVFLDGNCPLGHSVYANSDNNGPWGDALINEFIPQLEKTYRCSGARFLAGHSSGGWSVLWLQTNYPDAFQGAWGSSPDPLDFRNFQRINLYTDKNMFYDKDSNLRQVATVAGKFTWATMKNIFRAENVIYRGEQMNSFQAVFSKNENGKPRRLLDPVTGTIDSVTVAQWRRYDLSLYLRTNWESLKDKLKGKIRVSVGRQDNFLLNHSTYLFEEEMKKLNTGFEFSYYPGDHFTISTPEYFKEAMQFLSRKYSEWLAAHPTQP